MQIVKRKRLYNSGRVRSKRRSNSKKLSVKQKLFFGSKAQRASAKRSLSNSRKRNSKPRRRLNSRRRVIRRKNIGEIITLDLVRKNTGRRKNKMATRRRRRVNTSRRRRRTNSASPIRRRRRNRGVRVVRRRRRNTGARVVRRRRRNTSRVVRRRRRNYGTRRVARRRNVGRRRSYRRNSGYRRNGMGSAVSKGLGVVAGMFAAGKLTDLLSTFSPSLTSGPMSILATSIIAFAQGWAVKKFTGKTDLAENLMIGGLALAAIKALNMFAPQFSPSLSGLGLIGGSSFTYPQVNVPGNYGKFQLAPDYASAISAVQMAATSTGMRGIYPTASGGGRMGLKRVGRFS